MPIKNPSPELLEAIRQHGACPTTGTVAQWGYHRTEPPQIFLLRKDEPLPKGWTDKPGGEEPKASEPAD